MIKPAIALALLAGARAFAADAPDPYLWLESVDSPRAMAWVNARNAYSTGVLEADPAYAANHAAALEIGGAKDRIPTPVFLNGAIYNFWQDADHLRGIWRRTTLASYRTATPEWTTVLDIDALGRAEGKSWVWHGATCLEPEQRRCLIALSDGGEDATSVREFDLATGQFVAHGFALPHGKQSVAWEDADHLLVAREWQPGDITAAGYPYIVKRLARGAALDAAVEVFRGAKTDTEVQLASFSDGAGHRLTTIVRALDFFHYRTLIVGPAGARELALPAKAAIEELVAGRVVVKLDEDWAVGGATLPAGALVQLDLAAVERDPANPRPTLILAPGPRDAIEEVGATRDALLVTTLDNVRGRAWVFTPAAGGGWTKARLDLPDNLAVGLAATDLRSNRGFVSSSGFLTPSTLSLVDGATATLAAVKTLPAKFDASGDVVEQLDVASTDGTRIPYFVVHRRDIRYDGTTPTLLTAYGGFQVSRTPDYSATTGRLWLERGGALVLANIRGGGEFGPAWHEAGLATKRQIVYDDFAAVARDLIARKITSPRRLGIQGGSNGGLLMGVEFTQHPELFTAVVIQVPLLDMIRIGEIAAGASWQGEYGDVADPAVRVFWDRTSPYQNLRPGVAYPEPFIFTTTKDDRVGPQHARKFAARLEELGDHFFYYENTEGGHGAGADLRQAAHTTALTMTYLQKKLMGPAT